MSFSSRILGLLELELGRQLQFSFCGPSHAPDARPGLHQRYAFTVWLHNRAEFALSDVRGCVVPTEVTRFHQAVFHLDRIEPGQSLPVAQVVAQITGVPASASLVDRVATVTVSAVPDLSQIRFQEWDRPLAFAPVPGRPPAATRPVAPAVPRSSSRIGRRPVISGAIPLSSDA